MCTRSPSPPHVVVIPYPAQGHVIPLLEFSQRLATLYGIRVTFVNSDYVHTRILKSLEGGKNSIGENMHLVSIQDGMQSREDQNEFRKSTEKRLELMPGKLEELIEEINGREDEKISCIIADLNMGWAIELAAKMKIRGAVFCPISAAAMALSSSIPKLIEDGIINTNGTPMKKQMIQLAQNMPAMNSTDFFWARVGDLRAQKIAFDYTFGNMKATKAAEFKFCNSTYGLEPAAFTLLSDFLPVGPLLASNRLANSAGCFWQEDLNCLQWLEQQQPNSVIYVAFGSVPVFDKIQLQELALGLELCNRPFLWVVRPDFMNTGNDPYPEGFQERVFTRGKMIGWAPQQKVLSHPSIACFLSHCGWNSTIEGVSNGVPFLCWPSFADQLLNEIYIFEIWKVGLKFDRNKDGIITREEIKNKVEQLLGDEKLKVRALEIKKKVTNNRTESGFSNKKFQDFLEWIKA